jgi:hypothetical protein
MEYESIDRLLKSNSMSVHDLQEAIDHALEYEFITPEEHAAMQVRLDAAKEDKL